MVVMGSARVPGERRAVCSVAWTRQCVHLQHQNTRAGIKMAAHGGDSLPVVELKPFTKKTWSREKSLPNFYEKHAVKEEPLSETPRRAVSDPPPNIVRYIRELSDQRKTVDTRQSVDSTQRYRSKLHPKADFSFEGHVASEHQQDLIPSFTTRRERTKTALGATQWEENGTVGGPSAAESGPSPAPELGARELSNLMSAYTRDKPLQQQPVCLKGGKLSLGNISRRPLLYLKPFSAYRRKQPWTVCRDENSPRQLHVSQRNALSLSLSRGSGGVTSSANGMVVHSRHDMVLSGSNYRPQDRLPQQPVRVGRYSAHKFHSKLGAAQDSLSLLSRSGAPTVLEKNLSYDLELRMERCRKERSFAAIGETNVLSTAHYVAYDSQPTRGEITLMRAREANKSRDGKTMHRRSELQKPLAGQNVYHNSPNNIGFMFARAPDNFSPRSRSDQGDSGIQSSAGDAVDDVQRLGELRAANALIVLPHDLGEEVIVEQPGDCDEHYDEGEAEEEREFRGAGRSVWVPAKSVQHGQPESLYQQHAVKTLEKSAVGDMSKAASNSPKEHNDRPKSESAAGRMVPMSCSESSVRDDRQTEKKSKHVSDMSVHNSDSAADLSGRLMDDSEENVQDRSQPRERNNISEISQAPLSHHMLHAANLSQTDKVIGDVNGPNGSGLTTAHAINEKIIEHSTDTSHTPETSQNTSFVIRNPPADKQNSEPAANDMEVESVNSTSRSSPSCVDDGRDFVTNVSKKGASGERMASPAGETDKAGEAVLSKSDGQVQCLDAGAGTVVADGVDGVDSRPEEGPNYDVMREKDCEDVVERKVSQSGLPVVYNEQQNGLKGDSAAPAHTVSHTGKTVSETGQTLTENDEAPVEDGETLTENAEAFTKSGIIQASALENSDASEEEQGKNVGLQQPAGTPEDLSADASIKQATQLEHDTRVDAATTDSQELEKVATLALAEGKGDGFEGEKTFLTTTNVEAENWKDLVQV